jgi:GMP synthase (glutamine-hydrolysing)
MFLIVDNRSHFLPDLLVRLEELEAPYEILPNDGRISDEVLAQYAGIVLTGGPMLLERQLYLADISLDLEVLMEAQVPILGICLGLELIAATHGADIERLATIFEQQETIRVLKANDLFAGLPGAFPVQLATHGQVASLPDGFEVLATSPTFPYLAVKHMHRPIYGVQFHPEVSGQEGKRILSNFLSVCQRKR